MSFRGHLLTVLAIASAGVVTCVHESHADAAVNERALVKTAKVVCYEVYGGASKTAEVKPRMGTLEKILARNRASSLKFRGTKVGSLKYYYGMVPMERSAYGKWSRVYLGIQKTYVFVGKCSKLNPTSLEALMRIQCRAPGCRLLSGWQKMVVRSMDDPR